MTKQNLLKEGQTLTEQMFTKEGQTLTHPPIAIFDLDGTLVDSGAGIMRCAQHALQAVGISETSHNALRRFVGPPLEDSFRIFYNLAPQAVEQAVQAYRQRYFTIGIHEQTLYPGVSQFLAAVKQSGIATAIATSKMQTQAERVVRDIFPELGPLVDRVFARGDNGERHTKADVISHALSEMGVTDKSKAVMIGDRNFDILGAKACGLRSIGVTWGYAETGELETAGADFICHTFDELLDTLKGLFGYPRNGY